MTSIGTGLARAVGLRLLPGDELYAIECEGITQGLMMLDVLKNRCQIESQLRRRLVYISALATAPGTDLSSQTLRPTKALGAIWWISQSPAATHWVIKAESGYMP